MNPPNFLTYTAPPPPDLVLGRNVIYFPELGGFVASASLAYPVLPNAITVKSACGMRQWRAQLAYRAPDDVPIYTFTTRPYPQSADGQSVSEIRLIHPRHSHTYSHTPVVPLPPEIYAYQISRVPSPDHAYPRACAILRRITPIPGFHRWEFAYRTDAIPFPSHAPSPSSTIPPLRRTYYDDNSPLAWIELGKHRRYRYRTHRVVHARPVPEIFLPHYNAAFEETPS